MTTSFPPINYPSKPVPPFTAEPPRNQFPGFYPDMLKNIKGKPYITVSSKGLANGQSEYFNDGADFGPDSLQADGSLTQTLGLQEAADYITKNNSTIKVLDGTYSISKTVTFPSLDYINFKGNGRSTVIIPNTSMTSVLDISNIGEQCVFSDLTISSGINSDDSGGLSTYCIYGESTTSNNGFQTLFRNVNFWTYKTYPIYISSTANCFGGMVLDNVSDNLLPSGYYSTLGVYINISSGNVVRIINSHFSGIVNISTSELEIVNSLFWGIILNIGEGTGSIVSSSIYGSQNYNVDSAGNPANVQLSGRLSLVGCYLPNNGYLVSTTEEDIFYLSDPTNGVGYVSLLNCFISISNFHTTNLINGDTTTAYSVYMEKCIIDAADSTLTCNILSSSSLSNNMGMKDIIYSRTSSVTFDDYPSQPTTPSVPSSGTAQENTNPYAVDVYVYGGDVTEIQITRNGTAYTVLSVSTAIAMSGQSYSLNPGDSITVTYSTAPSWEWLSD